MRYIILLVCIAGLFACKTTKETVTETVAKETMTTTSEIVEDKGEMIFSYSRGGCYGRCPVYTVDIYDKGIAEYHGRAFSDKEGLWQKTLTKGQYSVVKEAIDAADYKQLDLEYKSMIPDLPRSTFEFHNDGEIKSVTGKESLPENLEALKITIQKLPEMKGWTKLSDQVKEEKKELNYDEIVIKFKPGVGLPGWFKKMKEHGVYLKRRVAPDKDLWVAGYKRSDIRPELILKMIKDDPGIESAEFNKKASPRR
jgi:hypothetical protein